MCHLAKLDLFLCFESIELVSISGKYRLSTPGEARSSFLAKYAKRDIAKWNNFSLHQYFHYTKNFASSGLPSSKKYIIPHYVGARSVPTYPPTEGYAKSVLILHVPWINTFNDKKKTRDYVWEFRSFLKTEFCPISVKIGYGRAKARYEQNKQFAEPTGKKENICYDTFSTDIDESVQEIVALASTLGLTRASNILEENEYFYGDELTD